MMTNAHLSWLCPHYFNGSLFLISDCTKVIWAIAVHIVEKYAKDSWGRASWFSSTPLTPMQRGPKRWWPGARGRSWMAWACCANQLQSHYSATPFTRTVIHQGWVQLPSPCAGKLVAELFKILGAFRVLERKQERGTGWKTRAWWAEGSPWIP